MGPRMTRVINGDNLGWIHKRLLSCLRAVAAMLDLKKSHFSPFHEPESALLARRLVLSLLNARAALALSSPLDAS